LVRFRLKPPWTQIPMTMNYIDPQSRVQPIPRGVTFPKLFQSSKLKARMSLFTETWQKSSSSFQLWALKQNSKISPQVGLAVLKYCWK